MADSVIINKAASIERCLQRIAEDYIGHETAFETEFMRQDAVLLNLQRACEQSIDLANHLVKLKALGAPQSTRDAFALLEKAGLIDAALAQTMGHMVGFRNIAVHEYARLNLNVVRAIIEKHLEDFRRFTAISLSFA